MKRISNIFLLAGLLIAPNFLSGQVEQLHLITKRLEKTFSYKEGYEVNIEGEKADVAIETWDRPEISITLELMARHPDKATAEADVEKIKYLAERVKNKIYLRNYISVKEGEAQPTSNLQARYVITVPDDCPVYLKNYFGVANVSNLTRQFRFFGEFTEIGLQNMQGKMDLQSRFGDIAGQSLNGNVSIASRRSNITLEDISGQFDVQSQYGIVSVISVSGLLDLNIDAQHGDVFLYDPKLRNYAYNLVAQHGDVKYPGDLRLELMNNNDELRKLEFKPNKEYYPSISISVSFGDVYLEKEKPDKLTRP
jgi:hypothetical protein